jgi:hypothetical protein
MDYVFVALLVALGVLVFDPGSARPELLLLLSLSLVSVLVGRSRSAN